MSFRDILRRRLGIGGPGQRKPRRTTVASNGQLKIEESLLRRLERLSLATRRTLSGSPNSGEHPSRQRLPASIFSEHRPYSPGDDYRHVDWNAYARHEQIVVKLGEAEQDINVHVLIDHSRSMAWGSPAKLVAAQQLAAAIGYIALAHSDRVQITSFGAGATASFGPAQGKGRAIEMLRFIGSIRAAERTEFTRTLQAYARQHERGGLLAICSDLLTTPAESLDDLLRAFAPPRWQILVLHTLDPRELVPVRGGAVEVEDAETGERVPLTLDEATLAAYTRNVADWQAQIASACARRGATYARISTDWPLEKAVVPYLRLRRIVR